MNLKVSPVATCLIDVSSVKTLTELRNAIYRGLGCDCGHSYGLVWYLEDLTEPTLITISGLDNLLAHLPTHGKLFKIALRDAAEHFEKVSVRFV